MQERTKHRAVGAAVLLLAAAVVLPLVLESEPPRERPVSEPAPAEPPEASPGRIRITTLDGEEEGPPTPKRQPGAKPPVTSTDASAHSGPAPEGSPPAAGWAVQIGSFADPGNAERLKEQVASRGYRVLTQPFTNREGKARVRVLVGPDPTRAAAAGRLSRLQQEASIQGFLVRYPG